MNTVPFLLIDPTGLQCYAMGLSELSVGFHVFSNLNL